MSLVVTGVTKVYASGLRANDGVSLTVEAGEVFGLLGPNGAGKTTLVSQVLGLVGPTSGQITVDGTDIIARPELGRRLCCYQPQASVPVGGLTPRQAVDLVGRIRGGTRAEVRRRGDELLASLDLLDIADKAVPLSGGTARLVAFCMAAVRPGRVAVLDEPTNDVDPLRRRQLWQEIRALADSGTAVLLVTHNVVEAERCVDRLAILASGRVLAEGTAASLKAGLGAPLRLDLTLEPDVDPGPLPPGVTAVSRSSRRLVAHLQLPAVGTTVRWCTERQDDRLLAEFSLAPASLEDVYAAWVTGEPEVAA